jgi:type I restriction enzyme S subunit
MKSNYKRLGDYIQEVNVRNRDLIDVPLLGVSIKKVLMPSIANTIGTDMSTYKLIQKNQFAYGPVTSRNGDKISIALLEEHDAAMVSQAYTVFEVIDKDEVLPEYLMMWFRRPEFDRYARFMSHGSAREIFSWTEMCETELPIPSPEKQQEIVKEYNIIQNRITLNNQLITKLEETAQAIYKQWFVDFEFPNKIGKPYKSNGGKMIWCEELEKEIPEGWEVGKLSEFILIKNGKTRPTSIGIIPVYGGNGIIDYVDNSNYENINIIGRVGAYCGSVYFDEERVWVSDNALAGISINNTLYFDYLTLLNLRLNSKSEGSSHPLLTQGILNCIDLVKSNDINVYHDFEKIIKSFFKQLNNNKTQNQKLEELKELLLARMTMVESGRETVEI